MEIAKETWNIPVLKKQCSDFSVENKVKNT